MTIADLACFSWINWAEWAGIEVKEFQQLKAWLDRINARPAIQKGLDVPEPFEMKKKMQSKVSYRTSGLERHGELTSNVGGRGRVRTDA